MRSNTLPWLAPDVVLFRQLTTTRDRKIRAFLWDLIEDTKASWLGRLPYVVLCGAIAFAAVLTGARLFAHWGLFWQQWTHDAAGDAHPLFPVEPGLSVATPGWAYWLAGLAVVLPWLHLRRRAPTWQAVLASHRVPLGGIVVHALALVGLGAFALVVSAVLSGIGHAIAFIAPFLLCLLCLALFPYILALMFISWLLDAIGILKPLVKVLGDVFTWLGEHMLFWIPLIQSDHVAWFVVTTLTAYVGALGRFVAGTAAAVVMGGIAALIAASLVGPINAGILFVVHAVGVMRFQPRLRSGDLAAWHPLLRLFGRPSRLRVREAMLAMAPVHARRLHLRLAPGGRRETRWDDAAREAASLATSDSGADRFAGAFNLAGTGGAFFRHLDAVEDPAVRREIAREAAKVSRQHCRQVAGAPWCVDCHRGCRLQRNPKARPTYFGCPSCGESRLAVARPSRIVARLGTTDSPIGAADEVDLIAHGLDRYVEFDELRIGKSTEAEIERFVVRWLAAESHAASKAERRATVARHRHAACRVQAALRPESLRQLRSVFRRIG